MWYWMDCKQLENETIYYNESSATDLDDQQQPRWRAVDSEKNNGNNTMCSSWYTCSRSSSNGITTTRKGAWSPEEDSTLIQYVSIHGEGRWDALARHSGLKRSGKSCRLRWLNYLRPNVRRGDFTPDEQLLILQLHCCYGNRWSKIAEYLPGRTDNEIKNYWRTRVQKQAKQLKCDVNSPEFTDFILNDWIPTLAQQAHAQYTGFPTTTAQLRCHEFHEDNWINQDGEMTYFARPLELDFWDERSGISFPEHTGLGDHLFSAPHSLLDSMVGDSGQEYLSARPFIIREGFPQEMDHTGSWPNLENARLPKPDLFGLYP